MLKLTTAVLFSEMLPSVGLMLAFPFPSRLCAAGVSRRPEADPHGGDEVPGYATS